MAAHVGFLDRVIAALNPRAALAREVARGKLDVVRRARAEYDGATTGRRADGWRRSNRSANGELSPRVQQLLRASVHDLVRNNAHAARAPGVWADHLVGTGLTPQVMRGGQVDQKLTDIALVHMDTTSCDAEGQLNLYGLQHLAVRSIVESGAVLARRRWRRASDRLPLPFQIQVIEPDYLVLSKDGPVAGGSGHMINGIEFDAIGRRAAYWLYSGHPGGNVGMAMEAKRIDARDVAHVYRKDRPEQQHGVSWLAPIILRLNDYADLQDAYLMRQKVASAYAVFISNDPDAAQPTGDVSAGQDDEKLEYLEPGIIEYLKDGKTVDFATPPSVEGYGDFAKIEMHAIATGVDLPYELMTGDHSEVSFISGRLARMAFKRTVEQRQWGMLIPQFCDPVGRWMLEAMDMAGHDVTGARVDWMPQPLPMASPETELPAIRDGIRSGLLNLSDELRAQGVNPARHIATRAADNAALDAEEIILDSDPRRVTAVGNAVAPITIDPNARGSAK